MAITNGTGVTTITSPVVSGQVTNVAPVLQREDGSFAGTVGVGDQGNPQYNIVAFDQTGNVLWSVPNDQPQIATADGGVIGQTGITYDKNGNATGQNTLPAQTWAVEGYASTDGQIEQIFTPGIPLATSYQAMVGGNPSANGTSIGVAQGIEGLPHYAIKNWGSTCDLESGEGTKVELGDFIGGLTCADNPTPGSPLAQYCGAREALLSGNYLTSVSCRNFFNGDPTRATYFSKLIGSVTQQIPYDGLLSNITEYNAGMINPKDPNFTNAAEIKRKLPVCGAFVAYRNRYGSNTPKGITGATSQINPAGLATDVYINTIPKVLRTVTQSTVLHEALHNLTGLYDGDSSNGTLTLTGLETLMGLTPNDTACPVGSICITQKLVQVGCAAN